MEDNAVDFNEARELRIAILSQGPRFRAAIPGVSDANHMTAVISR
jgi:hypothetical protein